MIIGVTNLEETNGDVKDNHRTDGSTLNPVLDTVRQGHSGDQHESESIGYLVQSMV